MPQKNILITGASRGIGLELVRQFLEQGERVLAVCRKISPELKKFPSQHLWIIEGVDVSEDADLKKLASEVRDEKIDVLINNAGIYQKEPQLDFSKTTDPLDFSWCKSVEEQFQVNSLAPLKVVYALKARLSAGSKVAMITSSMGSMAENTYGGSFGYRASKAALNMFSVCLARALKDKKVSVRCIHPGYVITDMTNHQGEITPEASVKGIRSLIEKMDLSHSGDFWHTNGEKLPW